MKTDEITNSRASRSAALDPFKPHAFFLENERLASGEIASTATILLTNKECPWRCVMCDLWKNTLGQSVPIGAIPRQIDYALAELKQFPEQVKLYNSGSFFDSAAIPLNDYASIAQRLGFAANVVVESHPRLIGERAVRLRDFLEGSLEVAMGLETIHPEVFPRLNKRFSLTHFAQAAAYLREANISMRAFVLVQPPFLEEDMAVEWAVKSAAFAFDCGASAVSLIPTRDGNEDMDALLKSGAFTPPRISTLERAQEESLNLRKGRVFADTWDLQRFSQCPTCVDARRERLHRTNLTQQASPRVQCAECGAE